MFECLQNIIITYAGTGIAGTSGDGGAAASAQLSCLGGVAVDISGNLYIAGNDIYNKVRKVNIAGIITTFAGTGIAGSSGDGNAATSAQLNYPAGIALDISGNVFIADRYNNKIRKVSSAGIITTYAGIGGLFGSSGDGGAATLAQLYWPSGVALDIFGNVYIVDEGNQKIRKVSSAGIVTTFAGTGYGANVYPLTGGSSGDGGAASSAQLFYPNGVAVDISGNVYIADTFNHKIRRVNSAGIITTFAGTGIAGSSNDGGVATLAQLNNPDGVAVDISGNVFIADLTNNKIRMVNSAGIITTYAGTGIAGSTGDGNAATSAQLYHPTGVALDMPGNVYIADYVNNKIRMVVPPCAAGTYSSTAGSGLCQQCSLGSYSIAVGATSCLSCPSGSSTVSTSSTSANACTVCASGYWSATGNMPCVACPAGAYNPSAGSTSSLACLRCSSGTYSTGASQSCQSCSAGTYNPSIGSTSADACIGCSAGYYSSAGSSICLQCGGGTYSTSSSQSCQPCTGGTYSTQSGSSQGCLQCDAGMYSASGASSCQSCPDGFYSLQSGSSQCDSCPTGYTGGVGATSCPTLTGGYIAVVILFGVCLPIGIFCYLLADKEHGSARQELAMKSFLMFCTGIGYFIFAILWGLWETCKFTFFRFIAVVDAAADCVRSEVQRQEAAKRAAEWRKREDERKRIEREEAARKAAEKERLRQEAAAAEAAKKERERIEAARIAAEEAARLKAEKEREEARLLREKERAALTPELFDEFETLERKYPKAVEYQKKTTKAKTALLAYEKKRVNKMQKIGEHDMTNLLEQAWKISAERHALQHTPEQENGVDDLHNKLLDLKRRLRVREEEHSKDTKSSSAMDFAEICQDYLKRIQKLVGSRADAGDLKIMPWSNLSPISGPSLLGAGNFGTVYKALLSVEPVAVKVVHSLECEDPGRSYDDELLRSLQEAERVMDICHSGGIGTDEYVTKVYGFVEGPLTGEMELSLELPPGDAFGIVLRLEAGGTLKERLHASTSVPPMPLSMKEKVRFIQQIARGLSELHKMGVVHADLKPANVLLNGKNPPDCRLSDFGQSFVREIAAGQSTLQYTQSAVMRGTPVYSAPEILQLDDDEEGEGVAGKASRSTDVYSLGIMMHEILSMQEPFKGLSKEMLRRKVCGDDHRPPLDQLPSDTPPGVRALMEKCWDVNRSNRPSAAECLSTMTHNLSVIESSQFNIFFSYSHSMKPFVVHLFDVMTQLGFKVWLDENNMGHDIIASMKKGIENSTVAMCFVDQSYQQSKHCQAELQHARSVAKKPVVVVVVEGNFWTWSTDTFKELCDVKTKMFVELHEVACQAWDDPDKVDGLLGALTASTSLQEILRILKDLDCRPSVASIGIGISSKPKLAPIEPYGKSKTSKVLPVGGHMNEEQPNGMLPLLTIDVVKDPFEALTPTIFLEYDELSKTYPLILQYEPLTEGAKEAFSAGQMDRMRRIGAAREALHYSPEPRFTIATGRSRFNQLEVDLQIRQKYLLKELYSPQSIESCVACSLYLDKVQEMLNSKAADMTNLLRNDVGIVQKKNYDHLYSSALTAPLQEEWTYLIKHYIKTLQYETLTRSAKQAHAAGQWNVDEVRSAGAQRAALNYTPPSGFTVESGRAQLESLRTNVERRQQIHLNALQRPDNIDYVVVCNECLDKIKGLLDVGIVSRAAPPSVSSVIPLVLFCIDVLF